MRQKANWETRSEKISDTKLKEKKKESMLEQRRRFLDMRRKKLSEMLAAEESQYRYEIVQMQETPEQVRMKMEQKLNHLKQAREEERLALVKQLEERRFYESADELRKNDSEAFAIACYLEQENQMLDKLKKRDQERREEEVYVTLNNYDNMKKLEKEKLQEAEKERLKNDRNRFLHWQREQQQDQIQKDTDTKNFEARRLKEQWEKDMVMENEEKEKMKEVNKMVYRDIEEFNKREEINRTKRYEIEKIKDKELVDAIVNKEKALDDIDKKEKERKIMEFSQNKKYLEYVMNQKKEAEAWMDKLAQIEADKQFAKQQEVWMKEEAARIELLKKVYAEREEAVKYKSIFNIYKHQFRECI
jgi:hypothetical protein